MKSVWVHGMLALLGLVLAYRTYTHEEKEEQLPGEVTVAECASNKLELVEIESPTHTVTIRPRHAQESTEYWVTQTKKPKPPPDKPAEKPADKPASADDKAKAASGNDQAKKAGEKPGDKVVAAEKATEPAPKPPEPPKQARPYDPDAPVNFLASKKFDDLLKSIAPLRAMRGLGEIPKAKFAEFGFDKVGTYLRVTCGGRKVTLEVGGRTYGTGDQYARDPKSKQAYLVRGQLLMDLQSAQYKFMQTDMHEFADADVDDAVIKAAGKERHLLHRNRLSPEEARWVDAAAPDKRNELFGNWFQRLQKLKVKSYLPEGKEPGSDLQIEAGAMVPVLTIEYRLEGKQKGKLELVRVDTKQAGFYYARTEATHRWTAMYDSMAKQIEEDAAMVVGAEAPATQSTPAAAGTPAAQPTPGRPASAAQPAPATQPALPPSHPAIPH